MSTQPGKSSIHLDEQSLNLLLRHLVNRPEGPVVSYRQGRFFLDQGDLKVGLQGLSLQDTQLDVSHAKFGGLRVHLQEAKFGPDGFKASLNLSPGS